MSERPNALLDTTKNNDGTLDKNGVRKKKSSSEPPGVRNSTIKIEQGKEANITP